MDWYYNLVIETTDADYPDIIHIPHIFASVTAYRQWRKGEGQPNKWLYDLVVSYWSHSQGGGAIGKGNLLGNHTISYVINHKHLKYHLFGYLLSYWSPKDIVYRTISQPLNPLRLFCVFMDALDANTTCCALVDVGRKMHPDNSLLPYVTSALLCQTGATIRWLDAKSRGKHTPGILVAPNSSLTKNLLIAFLWWHFGRPGGQNRNRNLVLISTIMTGLDMLQEITGFNAFANLHKPLVPALQALQTTFSLGESDTK